MVKAFFISLLIVTPMTPSEGWIQWSQPHTDKEACEEIIRKNHSNIEKALKNYMGDTMKLVKEFRCMTNNEAVVLNTKLGH